MEQARDARRHGHGLDTQERVLDAAVLDQLRGDVLDGVDLDRESDADVAVASARRLDLRVDADDAAARV